MSDYETFFILVWTSQDFLEYMVFWGFFSNQLLIITKQLLTCFRMSIHANMIDWLIDEWMDGWVGWTINTSHIPVYIQWYALLVCPSLSFLGQYLENTEYCKVCVSWHWMPTLVLLGVLRGHKNWNYAVNERQTSSQWYTSVSIESVFIIIEQNLRVPSIMKFKLYIIYISITSFYI